MVTALVGVLVNGASADIVTERSASVLVFPKVVANGTRDTLIQITNTSNSMVHAHCLYVNAAPTFREFPPHPIDNPPLWLEINFDIWLTKQQPTYWRVSTGRQDNYVQGIDPSCDRVTSNYTCPNSGFDPGAVPPVADDFIGELKCIETDQTGAPISGNHLKGEATIVTYNVCDPATSMCTVSGGTCATVCAPESDFDTAKYNAVGVLGNEFNNGDNVLCLGGTSNDDCPDPEYNGCPDTWILNHFAWEAENPALPEGSAVRTSITVVPCTQNFEAQDPGEDPGTVTLQLLTYNAFEQQLSASAQLVCWEDFDLPELAGGSTPFNVLFEGDTYRQTFIRSTNASSGVIMVATEAHQVSEMGRIGSASFNVHHQGTRAQQDIITIPADQLQ
jgi:hypothetical protein